MRPGAARLARRRILSLPSIDGIRRRRKHNRHDRLFHLRYLPRHHRNPRPDGDPLRRIPRPQRVIRLLHEQQLLRERHERLSNLPQEQQQVIRRDGARFEKLPPARREAMLQEFQKLRKMSETERSAYFDTPEFRDKFYPNGQRMISNLAKVLPVRK